MKGHRPSSLHFPECIGGYRIPNCLKNVEDRVRVLHRPDYLGEMSDETLFAETQRVRRAYGAAEGRHLLMPGPGPTCDLLEVAAWLLGYLRALNVEERRRWSAR
jgi:hypothetical protein